MEAGGQQAFPKTVAILSAAGARARLRWLRSLAEGARANTERLDAESPVAGVRCGAHRLRGRRGRGDHGLGRTSAHRGTAGHRDARGGRARGWRGERLHRKSHCAEPRAHGAPLRRVDQQRERDRAMRHHELRAGVRAVRIHRNARRQYQGRRSRWRALRRRARRHDTQCGGLRQRRFAPDSFVERAELDRVAARSPRGRRRHDERELRRHRLRHHQSERHRRRDVRRAAARERSRCALRRNDVLDARRHAHRMGRHDARLRGDSGGPALDAEGRVIGVASRGNANCDAALYGSVASWRALIVDTAMDAATSGGYSPPDWAIAAPVDAGTSDDRRRPNPTSGRRHDIGEPCAEGRCGEGFGCYYPDGDELGICVPRCSTDDTCPLRHTCSARRGLCLPDVPDDGAGDPKSMGNADEDGGCSCRAAVRPDGRGALALSFLMLMAAVRRRRVSPRVAKTLGRRELVVSSAACESPELSRRWPCCSDRVWRSRATTRPAKAASRVTARTKTTVFSSATTTAATWAAIRSVAAERCAKTTARSSATT